MALVLRVHTCIHLPGFFFSTKVAPEWRGMHTALTAAAVLSGVAAGIRVLAAIAIGAYLRVSAFSGLKLYLAPFCCLPFA